MNFILKFINTPLGPLIFVVFYFYFTVCISQEIFFFAYLFNEYLIILILLFIISEILFKLLYKVFNKENYSKIEKSLLKIYLSSHIQIYPLYIKKILNHLSVNQN